MKITLAIFVLLLYSCNTDQYVKENKIQYFYSDGAFITDSTLIRVLAEEVGSLKANNPKIKGEINVYSTLKSIPKLESFTDSLLGIYLQSIKTKDPEESFIIDTIDQSLLFDIGIVVYDNKNGKTLHYTEPHLSHYSLKEFMGFGKSSRFLGFILSMDKGYSSDDDFQAIQQQKDTLYWYDDKGNVTYQMYHSGIMPLKKLFWFDKNGEAPKYPYQKFNESDWNQFESDLKINLKVERRPTSRGCEIETNFIDLVESFMLIRNSGFKKMTSLISRITCSEGKDIYLDKTKSHRVLSPETNSEMLELLENNMKIGSGHFIKKELNLNYDCHIYWGRNQRDIGWVLYADKNKTIGIIIKGRDRLAHKGMSHYLSTDYTQKNPRILLPILNRVLTNFE